VQRGRFARVCQVLVLPQSRQHRIQSGALPLPLILGRSGAPGCDVGPQGHGKKCGPQRRELLDANLRPSGPSRTGDHVVCCPRKPPKNCSTAANRRKVLPIVGSYITKPLFAWTDSERNGEAYAVIEGRHSTPSGISAPMCDVPLVRIFLPHERGLERIHDAGLFEGRARYGERQVEIEDPYRFPPILSDLDLYLLGEGTHTHLRDQARADALLDLGWTRRPRQDFSDLNAESRLTGLA
jgi:hypothetical protein